MPDADVVARFAAAVVDPDRPLPAGVSVRPGADPGRRFAVYRNNVATGLVEALRAAFPVTERIVGADFFRAMARAFVARSRPASPLMFEYGAGFPDFVAGFAPADPLPYLAAVASLEAARSRAYHAADAPVLDPAGLAGRLAAWPGDAALRARVVAHPAALLVASRYPIVGIWAAHQGAETPRFDGPWRAESALVSRPADEVRVLALDQAGGVFAGSLLAGATVAEAGAAALAMDEDFEAGGALVALAGAGALSDVEGIPE